MKARKITNYLLGTIIILLVLSIGLKLFYNYRVAVVKWKESDREMLVKDCIETAAHFAVRFPHLTKDYCECTADSIMHHIKKAEYDMVMTESVEKQSELLLPVIAACYNRYQTAIFHESELGD